jgi:hypothetical protein
MMRRKSLYLSLAVAVLYPGLVAGLAEAATPSSGTVTAQTTSVSYSAGPFVAPNATGAAGTVTCNAAAPCDDFKLTVNVPATYASSYNLTVKVQWPTSTADFDVYVLDAGGNIVGSAASSSDPEVAVLPAVPGTYTVRVVPYAPLANSFSASVALTAAPKPATPGTGTPPGYVSYQPPATSGFGGDAGEPSIGANWKTGKVVFQSYASTLRVTFNDSVSPATATWENKSAAPPNCTAAAGLDPILWTDSQLGHTIESQLLANPVVNSLSCYTDNDGNTWTPTSGGGVGQGVDHQSIGGGAYAPGLVVSAPAYPHAVYYCSQSIAAATCARSDNGGLTFGPSMPVYTAAQCGGLHGHVKVGPDGTVYLPNKSCGGQQGMAVSTDNGMTWTIRTVPGSSAGASDPSVGIGADGTVYFGYQNGDGRPKVAVSHDRGVTWVNSQDISAPFGIQNTAFPAVVAGDGDRAAFAYLGTPTGGNFQDAGFTGVWHLYVAHTYDGGVTWITKDATAYDPVQSGCIWLGGGSNPCRNLLDFMDATVDAQGRVLVGYADGCTLACASNPMPTDDPAHGYHSQLATIARQKDGKRLFARYDQADLTVRSVTVAQGSSTTLTANVANWGSANAGGVVVKFMEGTTVLGTSPAIGLNASSQGTVSITWPGTPAVGTHTITAIVDPDNWVPESIESNNKTVANVTIN